MRYEIRAMSFGEILDTSFRVVRDHFLVLVGIGLVAFLPAAGAGELMAAMLEPGQPPSLEVALGMIGLALLYLAILPVVQAASIHAVGEEYLDRPTSIGSALRAGAANLMRVLGTGLLMGLAVMGAALLLVIPGLYLMLCFMLVMPVVMLEGLGGLAALRRSRELMRGSLLRGLGLLVLVMIVQAAVGFGVQIAFSLVPYVGWIGQALVSAVTAAFGAAMTVVLYFDVRARTEAFDLAHLAQLVESGGDPARASAA